MKNPNAPASRMKRNLMSRWSSEDYPGAEPRFQVALFAKDVATFLLLPIAAVVLYKMVDATGSGPRRSSQYQQRTQDFANSESAKSQIIEFGSPSKGGGGAGGTYEGFGKRSPGSLVRLRLLNVVETHSTAPVHAQIVDRGLGDRLLGGTLIGDAVPDPNFERINITFKYVRDPNRSGVAVQVSARALALDGTLGLEARKKEGFITRSVYSSAQSSSQDMGGKSGSADLKDILFRALTAGLVQEFGTEAQVQKNRSQVLTLPPSTEFFAELTDFFPGQGK